MQLRSASFQGSLTDKEGKAALGILLIKDASGTQCQGSNRDCLADLLHAAHRSTRMSNAVLRCCPWTMPWHLWHCGSEDRFLLSAAKENADALCQRILKECRQHVVKLLFLLMLLPLVGSAADAPWRCVEIWMKNAR